MKSCLYQGSVMHRRHQTVAHHFRYRLFWGLFDLDELPSLARRLRLFSLNAFNLFSLNDVDHGAGTAVPLRDQVSGLLADHGIAIDRGKVFLFCMPACFGYSFNPLSLYFCHDETGRLAAVIYQVHNTFGGRHHYIQRVEGAADTLRFDCAKDFYVSPFLEMGLHYKFKLALPDKKISVAIRVEEGGKAVLDAVLTGRAVPLNDLQLLRFAFVLPLMATKVMGAILFEATRLRLKGLRPRFPDDNPATPRKG